MDVLNYMIIRLPVIQKELHYETTARKSIKRGKVKREPYQPSKLGPPS